MFLLYNSEFFTYARSAIQSPGNSDAAVLARDFSFFEEKTAMNK